MPITVTWNITGQPAQSRKEKRKPVVSLLHKEVIKQQWAPVLLGINASNLEIKEQKLRGGYRHLNQSYTALSSGVGHTFSTYQMGSEESHGILGNACLQMAVTCVTWESLFSTVRAINFIIQETGVIRNE